MNRGMSAASLAELAKLQQRTGHLVSAYLDDETVRATDLFMPVVWGADTFEAAGHFLAFDGVEENVETMVQIGRVSLSGVDQQWISRVEQKELMGRRLVIYRVHFDSTWNLILNPTPVRDGLMDEGVIEEDEDSGKCIVVVSVTNHLRDFDSKRARHTNDQEQRLLYPADGFYKYTSQANRQLRWGAADGAPTSAPPPAPSGYDTPVESPPV